MNVYRINEYDMIIEDRINQMIRVIYFRREEQLRPITWTVEYGKSFVDEFTVKLLGRTPQYFQDDFIKYCKEHNIFQEILLEIKNYSKKK